MSRVALLTKDECPYCGLMKMLLQQHGVEFDELRVDAPPLQWLKFKMMESGLMGLPAIMLDNEIVPIGNRTNKALETLRCWGKLDGEGGL